MAQNSKTIEFMFLDIRMFGARLRLDLVWAARWGLNEFWEGPKTCLYPRTKTLLLFSTIIILEGIEKIKTGKMTTKQSEQSRIPSIYKLNGFYFASMKVHNMSSEAD